MTTETTVEFWKPREVAELFRVSPAVVLGWIHRGEIEARNPARRTYLIPNHEVERLRNTPFKPTAQNADEVKARLEEREARKQAAIARIRSLKEEIRKDRKNECNNNRKVK